MEESLKFHIKVRVFHKERAFGPGMAELMHLVEETGSLSEACRRMEMAYSKGWKTNRLPKVNLAILRLAIYEIKYVDDVPASVAINEAVELAKKYSGEGDYSFINGILGSVAKGVE